MFKVMKVIGVQRMFQIGNASKVKIYGKIIIDTKQSLLVVQFLLESIQF